MKPFLARILPILGVALIPALTACDSILGGSDDILGAQLRSAEQRWRATGPPQAYRYDLIVARGADTTAVAVRVAVQNGAIESITYVETGEPVPAAERDRYPAVEGLFALVRDALGRRVSGMAVQYDPQYGFPSEMAIDYDYRRVDDNIFIRASNFTRP